MNMQAMLKQAQKIQKEMMSAKEEIDNKIFEGSSSFVKIKMKGTKELVEVLIEKENLDAEEIEMLQDMIIIAINNTIKDIDKETENKLGKYTNGMPGLF